MDNRLPEPGDIFEERYRIDSLLGAGGFAHVYLATQQDLGRQVAIKVIKKLATEREGDQTAIERFRREAKLIARLRDPHTISLHDFGETDAGQPYMVTEYVAGESLDETLRREHVLAPARVVAILRQVLSSLEEAHEMGVLHRDIKPANILIYEHLRKKDQVKVLDFGIAKPMGQEDGLTKSDLTQAGFIVGTPRYMAPEYLKGEQVTPAADIYSLGLLGYELLVGKKAIEGETSMTIIAKQVSPDKVELPPALKVPRKLRQVIERMVAKGLDERFASAEQVLVALEDWDADAPLDEALPAGDPREDWEPAVPVKSLEDATTDRLAGAEVSWDEAPTEHMSSEELELPMAEVEAVPFGGGDVPRPASPTQKARAGDKSKLPLVALVVLLVALGVAGWFVLGNNETSTDPSIELGDGSAAHQAASGQEGPSQQAQKPEEQPPAQAAPMEADGEEDLVPTKTVDEPSANAANAATKPDEDDGAAEPDAPEPARQAIEPTEEISSPKATPPKTDEKSEPADEPAPEQKSVAARPNKAPTVEQAAKPAPEKSAAVKPEPEANESGSKNGGSRKSGSSKSGSNAGKTEESGGFPALDL